VLQRIVLAVIYLFLAVLQILVNWLEYACHKLERKRKIKGDLEEIHSVQNSIPQSSDSTNSPIMSYPPSGQIINTAIHEDRTPVVPSTISEAFKYHTDIEIVLSIIQTSIQNLEARLDQIRASKQAHRISNIKELLHAYGRNHSLHTRDDHHRKKLHTSLKGPVVHQSRTARRKETRRQEVERKRRETSMQDSADEEDSKRRDDEEKREVDKLVKEVHKSLGNGNIPNIRHASSCCKDQLYSDNKNLPIHVLPPSCHNAVFLNNPNMLALLFIESSQVKKLSPIDCSVNVQAARQEIVNQLSRSIHSLQNSSLHEVSKGQLSTSQQSVPISRTNIEDSGSIYSSFTHSSMLPLK
jgi:hypothetical protein